MDGPDGPPEGVRYVSGLILVSEQPERLVGFYRDLLGVPLVAEQHGDTEPHWGCELGDLHFAIHPEGDYPGESTATGAVKVAFLVFDLPATVAWLDRQGVPLCYPPVAFGTESMITAVRDPDGNLVELTQLGASWLDHLERRRADGHDLVTDWRARTATDPG